MTSIQIHRKGAKLKAIIICTALGVTVSAFAGTVTAPTHEECYLGCGPAVKDENYISNVALTGAAAGLVVGLLVGSSSREFKIEGKQEKLELFANEFKNRIPSQK